MKIIVTADILPINIELLRYRIYDENILYVEPENYQKVKISTFGIAQKAKKEKEGQEKLQKTYSVDDHLKNTTDKIKALYLKLREKIISIDENIKEEPKKLYIAYKLATNFVDVEVKPEWSKELNDALKKEGKQVEYFEYEGQDHNFKNLGWDLISKRTVEFYDKYLKR